MILEKYRREIRSEALRRQITHLYHFTPLQNVRSILTHGLVSARDLKDDVADGFRTDNNRRDGFPQCICLSIGTIYHDMLRSKQKLNRRNEWVVFVVDASVLWEHDCRFCWLNAASSEIKDTRAFIGGPWAFRRMFADYKTFGSSPLTVREKDNLPDNFPTDRGAEVQVFGRIGVEKFVGIGVATAYRQSRLEADLKAAQLDIPVSLTDWVA